MSLSLHVERCVHARATAATCTACVDTCPEGAVELMPDGPRTRVEVALDRCTACGLCQAACPTEALDGVFDVAALVAAAPSRLRCGADQLPCVGALSVEDLLSIVLSRGDVEVRAEGAACTAAAHERARAVVEEAARVLDALGVAARPVFSDVSTPRAPAPRVPPPSPVPPRRQFLAMFVPGAVPSAPPRLVPGPVDVARLRESPVTGRRRRLLAALPAAAPLVRPELAAHEVSFTTAKVLDPSRCNASGQCVVACPTGALSMSRLKDRLSHDASRCVGCHLCHDVCTTGALTRDTRVSVRDLVELAPRVLGRLDVVQCPECGRFQPRRGDGDARCARCRDEEAEALSLWSKPS